MLPFTHMSEKKDQEYFSDGLSEELIDLFAPLSRALAAIYSSGAACSPTTRATST